MSGRRCLLLAWALLLFAAACEDGGQALVDGGVGRRLEILDPPGAQLGLRYGGAVDLLVRMTRDDASRAPLPGEPVRFAIFGDPAGSTLARDVVSTQEDGVARVPLTAGNEEGSFHVRASAGGAADVEFAISTSMLEFVELDVQLSDPLPKPGARTLTALLYDDRACATIAPTPKPVDAARAISQPAAEEATLAFVNLLSRRYALVGRVEADGRLLAQGCVDVDPALARGGAHLLVPVRMTVVRPIVTGSFSLTTQLHTARDERSDGAFAPIDLIARCPAHLGQLLLDELVLRVSPARAAQIEAVRAAATPNGPVDCRPATLTSGPSLDADLAGLLTQLGPGTVRGALIGDLDALIGGGQLGSTLHLTASTPWAEDGAGAPARLVVDHRAHTVVLTLVGATRSYDLLALGLPVLSASGIDGSLDADQLTIGEHTLPVGLPALWGAAYADLSLAVRQPTLPSYTLSAWFSATVAAAERGAARGCLAAEDLVCERSGPTDCVGTLAPACAASVAAAGARLDSIFTSGDALRLRGGARVVDDDGDLVGEALAAGAWDERGALGATLPFAGPRGAP